MPLSDVEITDWAQDFLTLDTNDPQTGPGVTIAQLLDDEPREIKSVVRAESENKMWERWVLPASYFSAEAFTLAGDQRVVATPNRRIRATINSGFVYGRILTAIFGGGITAVTVEWDRDVLTGFVVDTDDVIRWVGDLTKFPRLPIGSLAELALAASDPLRVQRKVNLSGAVLGNSLVTFVTGGNWISDLTTRSPTRVSVASLGIDNTLSEVAYGLTTPVNFQSGMPADLISGTFDVTFDGAHDTFTIALPVAQRDALYKVQIQPTRIVSGVPSLTDWAKPMHSGGTITAFSVKFGGVLAAGAVTSYDYVIQRTQL